MASEKQRGRSNMWQSVAWLQTIDFPELCSYFNQCGVPVICINHNLDRYSSDCFDSSDVDMPNRLLHRAGELKKPHAHFIAHFDSLKSLKQVQDTFIDICFATNDYYEKVISKSASHRYLCHLDHPDKYQYPIESVCCFNGAVYEPSKKLSPEARAALVPDIVQLIKDEQICSYAYLCQWVCAHRPELIPVVMKDYAFGLKCVCESVALDFKNGSNGSDEPSIIL